MNLTVNSHTWLVATMATMADSTALEYEFHEDRAFSLLFTTQ